MVEANILEIIAAFVAVVGGFKALEWLIGKITSAHDKNQKIDTTDTEFQEFKAKTEKAIAELNVRVNDAHRYATDSLQVLEKNITKALEEQKTEYMKNLKEDKDDYIEGIKSVEASITEMQAVYQQTVAVFDVKLDALTTQVEKHNSVVSRTYELEKQVGILDNREKVSEHRLDDLEKKNKC